jgi:predicted HD superfamily hydrolase involved in NAD metabolism
MVFKSVDIYSDAFYESTLLRVKKRVDDERFEHILSVSATCELLAKVYGVDEKRARLAGALHDWDKCLSNKKVVKKARKLKLDKKIDPVVIEYMPKLLHGPTAAFSLKKEIPELPDDILHAIEVHTIACQNMSNLDMVLYVADAIEPTRSYPELDELTSLIGKVSLEELFYAVYRAWTVKLILNRRLLHPDTLSIYNSLVKKLTLHVL